MGWCVRAVKERLAQLPFTPAHSGRTTLLLNKHKHSFKTHTHTHKQGTWLHAGDVDEEGRKATADFYKKDVDCLGKTGADTPTAWAMLLLHAVTRTIAKQGRGFPP